MSRYMDLEANEYDELTCPNCNGSGEGMHEGETCTLCKGSGVEYVLADIEEPEDEN